MAQPRPGARAEAAGSTIWRARHLGRFITLARPPRAARLVRRGGAPRATSSGCGDQAKNDSSKYAPTAASGACAYSAGLPGALAGLACSAWSARGSSKASALPWSGIIDDPKPNTLPLLNGSSPTDSNAAGRGETGNVGEAVSDCGNRRMRGCDRSSSAALPAAGEAPPLFAFRRGENAAGVKTRAPPFNPSSAKSRSATSP
mmetsp:Transcript_11401/g.38074  ORF Transcript_11401/g.38074 Transcript_11401/m.38074 type:complete len:202 (-) Transcript_11401:1093-1698(-)